MNQTGLQLQQNDQRSPLIQPSLVASPSSLSLAGQGSFPSSKMATSSQNTPNLQPASEHLPRASSSGRIASLFKKNKTQIASPTPPTPAIATPVPGASASLSPPLSPLMLSKQQQSFNNEKSNRSNNSNNSLVFNPLNVPPQSPASRQNKPKLSTFSPNDEFIPLPPPPPIESD